ncbi:ATP-binding protein [Macrococcus caseolyticus]|uniref:ATP-binding protein n=1 Tax=Macrococcoides caseolyticum TaxID=69966 RepID=UPI0011A933EC|nr:ATP-binding protein [Macrococcus caseolyticus]MDJ1152754.1 ATP-binding protein [Macrococcus caseolyticus]
MNEKLSFSINNDLISVTLGKEIIENHSIAIAEQIRNSRDANATNVTVDFTEYQSDKIVIADNGEGMSLNEIKEKWFMLGSNHKREIKESLGGKGIGRFSIFKLGDCIEIETVKEGTKSIFVIEKSNINNISVKQELSNSKDGTRITITKIDPDISFYEIEKDLYNLILNKDDFEISLKFPSYYENISIINNEEIKKVIPYSATIKIMNNINGVNDINYHFLCEINKEMIYENRIISEKFQKELNTILKKYENNKKIGEIYLSLNNFNFDKKLLKLFDNNLDVTYIKDHFLNVYQGINVYRNNFKIFGHGSEDWLKLAENRLKKPGENIDNKLTYGTIVLKENNDKLIEKSNREGFISDNHSKYFRELILIIVKQFGLDRKTSISKQKEIIENQKQKNNRIATTDGVKEIKEPIKKEVENESLELFRTENNESSNKDIDNKDDKSINILKSKNLRKNSKEKINLISDEIINNITDKAKLKIIDGSGSLVENYIIQISKPGNYQYKYVLEDMEEHLEIIIQSAKVKHKNPKSKFFQESTWFHGDIDLREIHDIVYQLKDLDYEKKYLLYLISFRTILDDILKNYIANNDLKLDGDLKNNVDVVVEHILKNIKQNPNNNVVKIHRKFNGYNQLKDNLKSLQTKFSKEHYSSVLNKITHNPSPINSSFAAELSNEIILPLYVLIFEMRKEDIIR